MTTIDLRVNNRAVHAAIDPRTPLADFLRDQLHLTGTHLGCEHGVCGACTLLLDGSPARSCITYAAACDGAEVTTIEGLDDDEIMIELRAAFTREHALQCGYCTPGMLVSSRDLVRRLPEPDERSIRIGLSGNLCRCTGYVGIVRAVQSVIAGRRARNILAEPDAGRRLGPVGSGHGAGTGSGAPLRPAVLPQPEASTAIGDIPDVTPAVVLDQHFDVAHSPEQVFALFGDIATVAACLPGASITAMPTPQRVDGAIRVRLGPILANFHGAARVSRDAEKLSGCIVGIGSDQRSRSATQGEIRYRLVPIENGSATRVELSIGYNLTGMLAQVGRPGLIRDLAARLIAEFAKNIDLRLSGASPRAAAGMAPELNGVALVVGLLRDRMGAWLRRLSGRKPGDRA